MMLEFSISHIDHLQITNSITMTIKMSLAASPNNIKWKETKYTKWDIQEILPNTLCRSQTLLVFTTPTIQDGRICKASII